MSGVNPQAYDKISVESVSGANVDRAFTSIGVLNTAAGGDNGIGSVTIDLIDDGAGGEGEIEDAQLSQHRIGPNVDDYHWKANQIVYYQVTQQRVEDVHEQLAQNVEELRNSVAGSITALFETLQGGINAEIADEQQALDAALAGGNTQEVFDAQAALAQAYNGAVLSNADIVNLIDNFFEQEIDLLSVDSLNENIFDLLHNTNNAYSQGTTTEDQELFYFERNADVQRILLDQMIANTGDNTLTLADLDSPVQILNSADAVYQAFINDQRFVHEHDYGNFNQNDFEIYAVNLLYDQGRLNLSDEVTEQVINSLGLSEEALEERLREVEDLGDFLELVSFDQLVGFAGSEQALLRSHVEIATPKYYRDQRSIYDLLNGRDTSLNNFDKMERVFTSIDSQMSHVGETIRDLLKNGYDKASASNLEIGIRNAPLLAMEYFEYQLANNGNLTPEQTDRAERIILATQERQMQRLENIAELINDSVIEIRKLEGNGGTAEEIAEVYRGVVRFGTNEEQLIESFNAVRDLQEQFFAYTGADQLPALRAGLTQFFPELAELEIDTAHEFDHVADTIARKTTFINSAEAIYAMELTESQSKNMEYSGRKLPEIKAEGEQQPDNAPIPPLLYPSSLSLVVTKIGQVLNDKSQKLIEGDYLPTAEWMEESASMLHHINTEIEAGTLQAGSVGEAFRDSLRDSFIHIITNFFEENSDLREAQTDVRAEFENSTDVREIYPAVNGIGGNNLGDDLQTNLDSINGSINGNLKDANNFVTQVGLSNISNYLENQRDDYNQQIGGVNNQINAKQGEINDKQGEINAKQAQIDAKQAEIDEAAANEEDTAQLEAEKQALEQERNALEQERTNLNNERQALENTRNGLAATRNDINRSLYGPNGSYSNPRPNSVQGQINRINDSRDNVVDATLERINTNISNFNSQISNIDDDRTRIEELITEAEAEGDTAKVAELEQMNSDLEAQKDAIQVQKEALQEDRNYLTQNGISDAQQILRAEEINSRMFTAAVEDFSDAITNLANDADADGIADVVERVELGLDETTLDIDGNGVNDFEDMSNIVENLGELAENLAETFGGKEAVEGGIEKQTMRRLLLMLFVFQMLEQGEWDFLVADADVTRYQVT